ncbi:hypothetical protein ACFPIJ_17680 [Dactylosporangium cerinum]|uniref:Uncharacterized protein n=1 Tax=Dactylosporangium cerinum TaxID=1434730 RepID=A0ABV9VU47_9ACTN
MAVIGGPGASSPEQRKWESATDGSTGRLVDAVVSGVVQASEPSRLGAGLLDITVDSDPREPLPTGVLDILGHWRTGRPVEKNLWAGYDRELLDLLEAEHVEIDLR